MEIPVINFDERKTTRRVDKMFPNILRCAILGPSGCGKTNVLMTILLHKKAYDNIYLCSKTSDQPKYKLLRDLINDYNEKTDKKKKIGYRLFSNVADLPSPGSVPKNSIIIFDDILTEKQDKIADFFLTGRHRNISCIYLAQSYTKIPKTSGIRENFNFLVLFRQDSINIRQVHTEHLFGEFNAFKRLCETCWKKPYGFIVVDKDNGGCIIRSNFSYNSLN